MKTVFITGGDKGIGFALAQALGQQGWQVIISSRTTAHGQNAIRALTSAGIEHPTAITLDLNDPTSIMAVIETLSKQAPHLTLLINNAGIPGSQADSLTESIDDLRTTMQVNFFGTTQLTQGLLPQLAKNNGRIINVTIPTAPNPHWNPLAYKASKAAQNVMMQTLALDLQKQHSPVEIFSIHPGPTTTDLNGNTKLPGFHSPANVAKQMGKIIDDGQSHQGQFIEIYPELTGISSVAKGFFTGLFKH